MSENLELRRKQGSRMSRYQQYLQTERARILPNPTAIYPMSELYIHLKANIVNPKEQTPTDVSDVFRGYCERGEESSLQAACETAAYYQVWAWFSKNKDVLAWLASSPRAREVIKLVEYKQQLTGNNAITILNNLKALAAEVRALLAVNPELDPDKIEPKVKEDPGARMKKTHPRRWKAYLLSQEHGLYSEEVYQAGIRDYEKLDPLKKSREIQKLRRSLSRLGHRISTYTKDLPLES